ncbi:MAG: recombination mediator RecR [Planctomycetota bacterium]
MADTDSLRRLKQEFGRLPGIGERSADRLALHVLADDAESAMALARAIRDVKRDIRPCGRCFGLSEGDLCEICADPARDRTTVCVVERATDMRSFEAAGGYQGSYHVLGGQLAPLDGVGPDDLTFAQLLQRVQDDGVTEVILATNPTAEGDATGLYLARELRGRPVRVTRLARGLPSGGRIEHANPTMLADALGGRTEMTGDEGGGDDGDGAPEEA